LVFIFRFRFWSVLRFRYVRFSIEVWGIHVWVFWFRYSGSRYSYSGSEFWSGIEEVQVCSISIEVWVFWLRYSQFRYSYSGSEFWSGIEVQVLRFTAAFRGNPYGSLPAAPAPSAMLFSSLIMSHTVCFRLAGLDPIYGV